VQSANAAPTAAFDASCIDLGCTFTDASSDTDGTIASWRWNFGDGVVITETTSTSPLHDYATAGRYTAELRVTDNGGATHAASQVVTVGNPAPNAAPTAEFTWQCPVEGLTCTFHDEGSADDTRVAEWSWNFGDGATATSQTPSHTFTTGGTFSVSLIVKDNEGAPSNPASHDVTVTAPPPPNKPPTAGFSVGCTNLSCTFMDQSNDTDGSIVSRSWSFGDGTTSTGLNPAKTYAAGGTYTVRLTVTDNGTATATASKVITVSAPVLNSAPKAYFGSACTGLVCKFTDRSTDADGNSTIVKWSWAYGDGKTFTTTTPAARNPSYTYAAGGTYKPRLTVTDNKGAVGSILHIITVTR
jgi:PKD repeat protein